MTSSTMWIVALIIIVVIAAGAWYFRSAQPTTLEEIIPSPPISAPVMSPVVSPVVNPVATPTSSAMTISVDESGFSPATVTVPVGTTVTFVNNGQAPHWPASAVHPTHEMLPGFDAKRGLQTGETYSFIFSKAGTWGFHDHLNPSAQGSVVVR